jgi:hypothetical protein
VIAGSVYGLLHYFRSNIDVGVALRARVPLLDAHGRAVQVEPMKPQLKPTGTKRLTLSCDILLSGFAFQFNLRRYTTATCWCTLARRRCRCPTRRRRRRERGWGRGSRRRRLTPTW